MSQVLVNESSLQDIADAIREKNASTDTYLPSAMGAAIRGIVTGGQFATGKKKGSNTKKFSVTGLSFKPSIVFVVSSTTYCGKVISAYASSQYSGFLYYSSGGAPSAYLNQYITYSFTDGGFSLTMDSTFIFSNEYTFVWMAA